MNAVESLIPFDHFFTFRTAVNTRRHCAKIASNRCKLDKTLLLKERLTGATVCKNRSITWQRRIL